MSNTRDTNLYTNLCNKITEGSTHSNGGNTRENDGNTYGRPC